MPVVSCSSILPIETGSSFGETVVFFIVLSEGLPMPGIDFFEDFPLLTQMVANFEQANSL